MGDYDPLDTALNYVDDVDTLLADPQVIALIQAHLDSPAMEALTIHALSSEAITPEERALKNFSRRNLQTLPTWTEWLAAEQTQLDQFNALGMFGEPCIPPANAMVLRPQWTSRVKTNGKRRRRLCGDGSKQAQPQLHLD